MAGRNNQVARIYKLLEILGESRAGITAGGLCQILNDRGFQVTLRTIYRDIDALRAAGFPLEEKDKTIDSASKWHLEKTPKVSHFLVLESEELMALYLAKGMLHLMEKSPISPSLQSVFEKIESKIPTTNKRHLNGLSSELHFDLATKWGIGLDPDLIETIRSSISKKLVLEVDYTSQKDQAPKSRRLAPHFLYFAKGNLYVIARDLADHKEKTFSLPRFGKAKISDDSFEQEELTPDTYFANAFGIYASDEAEDVVLHFHPPVAKYVSERSWHETQTIKHLEKGCVELKIQVGITPELVQWVLGFGTRVKIVAPQNLIEIVTDEARQLLSAYQAGSESTGT